MFTVNRHPSQRELRKFGTGMIVGFGGIGVVLWCWSFVALRWHGGAWAPDALSWSGSARQIAGLCCVALGSLLFVLVRVAPTWAKGVYVFWMSVTVPVGIVMSTIMLTVMYFVLLPVFSLIVRMGDPLGRKLKANGSYWEDYKPHEPTIDRMERQF